MFDDRFDTVKNEPNDTSLWQRKAHFTKLTKVNTSDLLISTPTHTQVPTPSLPPYASEIPAALLQLPDLPIPQTNNKPGQADGPESPAAPPDTSDLPPAVPVDPMPPTAPSPTYPINIAPTGTTCTGRQVRTPSRFGYAAYLAKTALSGIADLHPLACLQMISGDINQPEGYPDAMPLDVALAQPDRDNFIGAMEKELKQHSELKHWHIVHRSQVPRNAKPIPMVWTLRRKRDPTGTVVKWKARLCAGGSSPNIWRYLLAHLRPSCVVDHCSLRLHTCPPAWMAYAVYRLYNGIHSSQGQDRHLYDSTQGHHHSKRRPNQAPA